jgi:hypothetical protein
MTFETADLRRPLLLAVWDFPRGLVGADGSTHSACKTARCRRLYPRQFRARGEPLWEIADAKTRPSAPARPFRVRVTTCSIAWPWPYCDSIWSFSEFNIQKTHEINHV